MTRTRSFLLLLGIVSLLLVATYAVLSRTGATRALAEHVLRKFIRSGFELKDADLDVGSGLVRLLDLTVLHPKRKSALLGIKNLTVAVDTNPLGEVGSVHEVRASGLMLDLSLEPGEWPNLAEVLHLDALTGGGSTGQGVPAISITDSRILLRLRTDRPPIELAIKELRLVPDQEHGDRIALAGDLATANGEQLLLQGTAARDFTGWTARLDGKNIALTEELARALNPKTADWLLRSRYGGRIGTITAWLAGPATGGPTSLPSLRGSVTIAIERLNLSPEELPYPLEDAKATVVASLDDGGKVQVRLEALGPLGILEVGAEAHHVLVDPTYELRIRAREVPVSAALGRVVCSQPEGRDVWQAFGPNGGMADGDLRLWTETPGEKPNFAMDLTMRDVAARFIGFGARPGSRPVAFPHPLESIRGKVQVRPGTKIVLHELHAGLGGGEVVLNGNVDTSPGRDATVSLDVDAKDVPFSQDLRDAIAALEPESAAIWDAYAPNGRADAKIRVRSAAAPGPADLAVEILPRGASASWTGFPYRVGEITGRIEIARGVVVIDLDGRRGESAIELEGRFDTAGTLGPNSLRAELAIRGRSVAFDPELATALKTLDPTLGDLWDELRPGGKLDCEVALWRAEGQEKFTYDTRIDLRDATANMRELPVPLVGLHGPILVHGAGPTTDAVVHLVRGKVRCSPTSPEAELLLHGTAHNEAGGRALDLTGIIRNLTLDAPLADCLVAAEMFTRSTWEMLAPEGTINVVLRILQRPGVKAIRPELRIELDHTISRAKILPAPATELVGELEMTPEGTRFKEITGLLGTSRIVCSGGGITHGPDGDLVRAKVSADEVPVDARLANMLSGPLRQAFLDHGIADGVARVADLDLSFLIPKDGGPFQVSLTGTVVLRDVSMVIGAPLQHASGTIRIDRGIVDAVRGEIEGEIRDASFHILDHPISGFSSRFLATRDEVVFPEISLRLHEGIVQGGSPTQPALRYDLVHENVELHASLQGMSLTSFLSVDGQQSPLRGTVSGRFDIDRLPGTDLVEVEGKAALEITHGKLGEVPLFRAIYSLLEESKRPRFDHLQLELVAKSRELKIAKMFIGSSVFEVQGAGTCTMDGYLSLDLEFPNLFGKASKEILVPEVLRWTLGRLVRPHFYGYLRDPHSVSSFLFRGHPERRPLEPIPPKLPARPQRRI